MFFANGFVGLFLLALWLFAIFDVISTDSALCRNIPKGFWLMLVIFLPVVGSISWLLLGRPEGAGYQPGSTNYGTTRRSVGVEDSNAWIESSAEADRKIDAWEREQAERAKARELDEWEAELRRREEELRKREQEGPTVD